MLQSPRIHIKRHLLQTHAQHTNLERHTDLQNRTQIQWRMSRRVALHAQMNVPSNVLGGTSVTSAFMSPPPCTTSQILISYQRSTEKFTLVHANTEWLSSLLLQLMLEYKHREYLLWKEQTRKYHNFQAI